MHVNIIYYFSKSGSFLAPFSLLPYLEPPLAPLIWSMHTSEQASMLPCITVALI